jgi:hypothetical protein
LTRAISGPVRLDSPRAPLARFRFPPGDAMDWYLIGRILGVIFWPALAAVALYGIGWAIALSQPPQRAGETKRWARIAAFAGLLVTLAVTGRDFLTYAGGAP